jgi:hypothetical protein
MYAVRIGVAVGVMGFAGLASQAPAGALERANGQAGMPLS